MIQPGCNTCLVHDEDMTPEEFDAAFQAGEPVGVDGRARVIVGDPATFPGATSTVMVRAVAWAAGRTEGLVPSFTAPGATPSVATPNSAGVA